MDDLLNEFLTETKENLDKLDTEIVCLEQEPHNPELLGSIFRVMHTIKGTCGFLGLPRLEKVAHAAENVLDVIRKGKRAVTPYAISVILEAIDQIKFITAVLEESEKEPDGDDKTLIACLNAVAAGDEGDGVGSGDDDAGATVPDAVHAVVAEKTVALPTPPSVTPVEKPAVAAKQVSEKEKNTAANPEAPDQTIRVSLQLLESLMNTVSELVLTRNQLLQIGRMQKDSEFTVPLQRLSHVTSELQENVMKTRMQPIGNAWNKLPRIIRDLANELHKKIDLQMVGEDTELDRQVLEMIKDPLTHMVRNSADHGIESPDIRKAAGKSETGIIKLEAYHEGGHIIISISDDGKGLAIEKIKEKVLANGLATEQELSKMSEQQINQFIFRAGFSTAAAVTSVSGRGVGMDVVRTNIEKIGGTIDMRTAQGKGSTFTIKIPLTLAIVSALIVGIGKERFAIPQLSVVELVRVTKHSEHVVEYINGVPVLRLREHILPLVSLKKVLGLEHNQEDTLQNNSSLFIIVTQVGAYQFGMIVDKVFDTEEIVVKPVSSILRHIALFSGNTILGDGSVIMILDPNGIAAKTGEGSAAESIAYDQSQTKTAQSSEDKIAMLVFTAGGKTPYAVPLALVARLEEVEMNTVEFSSGQPLVQYRGALMPLVMVTPDYPLLDSGVQPILVFSEGDRSMGLLVDKIVDITEEAIKINLPASDNHGLLGSAIIRGAATDIIDAHYYINLAFADWFKKSYSSTVSGEVRTRNRRLLIVDDSAFFRNLLVPVLSVTGYEVIALENPIEAIALREKGEKFDLIISDIEMPQMDGFAFARNIKTEGGWNNIPLVALSSYNSPEGFQKAKMAGFDTYVPKFDRDALLQTIERILGEIALAA
jgi:two-component system chemotaxis sensor kinase CheA